MSIKNLYIGKRIEDLDALTAIPNAGKCKISALLDTAKRIVIEAEKFSREGDEERAYIFYMRYFNLLDTIYKRPNYSEFKSSVRQVLGSNDDNKAKMDKLETLSQSLVRRYNQKNGKLSPKTPPEATIKEVEHISPGSWSGLSSSEKFDRLKSGATMQTSPVKSASYTTPQNVIECTTLFELMKNNKVLIMDCRPSCDYKQSHLEYSWAFNVPQDLITPGMSAGKLQDQLSNVGKVMWSARAVKDHVVLMDWNSENDDPPENSPIAILSDILQFWDPDVTYRAPIKILKGGYEYFIMMYPTQCTNPSVQAPRKIDEQIDLIDDIEYPSIHDITMKDEIRGRFSHSPSDDMMTSFKSPIKSPSYPPKRPSVDRSSKKAALLVYEENQKSIAEIVQEQQELLEKAHENDEKLEQASKSFSGILEKQRQGGETQELTMSEQQLLYTIMQLENDAKDYKTENNRLREELDKYLAQECEQNKLRTELEQAKIEQTKREIESKIQERQRLDEQHEREKQERERLMAIARESKKPTIENRPASGAPAEMETLRQTAAVPPMPRFDRATKPQQAAAVHNANSERYRDFSPVPGSQGPGLTGLKNLGNTCYMNSILQCLSNTSPLAEYCITDKFKAYISRSNETKGQIVEEVAALIKVLWNGHYKCVASKDLRYIVGQYQQMFRGIEQQDAHEFLTILMDWLHSDLQTMNVMPKSRDVVSASEKAWLAFTKGKESLISRLFYGQIKSTVKCVACSKESATYESFSNLSLELPPGADVCHLDQCLAMYFSGESIEEWDCPNCKQKRDAIKKLDISKLPPVLVIHLKRFYAPFQDLGKTYKKKQNYVRFPLDNLDMSPHIARSESRSGNPKTYQLYSVSNHYGSMESGHYTAFCKSGNFNKWFKFDDQTVTPIDKSSVVSSAAYILFYTYLPPEQISATNEP